MEFKGSTRNRFTTGQVQRVARQLMQAYKLQWTAALAKAKAILAL